MKLRELIASGNYIHHPQEAEEINLCDKCETCTTKKKWLKTKMTKAPKKCESCEVTAWCYWVKEAERDPTTNPPDTCELSDCPVHRIADHIRYINGV